MAWSRSILVLALAVGLAGHALAVATPAPPPRPAQPTLPGRAWTAIHLGGQGDGEWSLAAVAPAGKYIDTWKLGIGHISGTYGTTVLDIDGTVSVQGRLNDGTWLPQLNGTQTATSYITVSQADGFKALWGRAGGWLTNILGAAGTNDDRDDLWSLNGANVAFAPTAKVVGYQLRTFDFIGDASFAFDSTI